MALDLSAYRQRLSELAAQGLYVGTSSWKYPGWCGQIYDEQRYLTRSRFSEAKFNRSCHYEYAKTFSTVCVDAGYYQFPTEKYLAELCERVPGAFRFGFKVTDEVTIKKFPNLPRFGARAGLPNANFLNAEMFGRLFLQPCEAFRAKIGPLIFEFSQGHKPRACRRRPPSVSNRVDLPIAERRTLRPTSAVMAAPTVNNSSVDKRSEGNIATLLPEVQKLARSLVHAAADIGITIKVISGTRTYPQQDAIYLQGRASLAEVNAARKKAGLDSIDASDNVIRTKVKGGGSNHNFGIAFDVGVFTGTKYLDESPLYAAVAVLGKQLGLTWGGDWKDFTDKPHYELRPKWAAALSEKDMLAELRKRKDAGNGVFV